MADVILFRPKVSTTEARAIRPRPPLGLLFVAAPLVKNGYKVSIIDAETDFNWLQDLDRELSDSTICVGVSSMTGTQILGGLKFAKAVKDKVSVPIVWGGLHATMLPDQTINNELVDVVVRGEGEDTFLNIVNILKDKGSLDEAPNVWWKKNNSICSNPSERFVDINSLPELPYDLVDCEMYIKTKRSSHPGCKRVFDIHTDRGCPHRCGFCYNINANRRKWRPFTASKVIEDIDYLVKRFSLDGLNFLGDNFFVDKKRVVHICEEIIKRNINIKWHADCRIDYFVKYEDSFIDLLKRSGCELLTFGVESGSERMLEVINKDISLGDLFKANKKLKDWQIGVNYHFMAGFPEEKKEDVFETYNVMLKLSNEYPGAVFLGPSVYTPYPGTPLYDRSIEMGLKPPDKLEEWARFDWDGNSSLPFITPEYSKWLMASVNVVKNANTVKRIFATRLAKWWFKMRIEMIVKFNMVGPQIEEKAINFAKAIVTLAKKILRVRRDV
ncbi:B12-binding domain-containing radical SAM protein [Candidatus Omnitrophota bacterium]